ncbi:beta-galactosidase [Paenibacillus soyae]|uniref:Beta-galactosidase n=1 Tax=Paenibacillus soyae TaxID=2969249 RepID=A0A9X2S8D4_9BACL|nr:beta-galactosidase [Paenibacillus soyae]MCR2804229.1 beta-galactosidase [Paenibacillus soyae]
MNTITSVQNPSVIGYDNKSFILNGKRVFLSSAAIHYFRMAKEEWREVLVKAKLAGMNCIDTYFAWNVHEPNEGEWRFEGDADCGAFLDLCAELGLWVIARPGPFICAEWDFGGFPWWLGRKEGVKFREYNDVFLKYVDLYFDRIAAVIRTRQITAGGSVILVQVENEYGYLGSDETGRPYLTHLRDGLLTRGIDVPLLTCVGGVEGAVEGANFWSGADHHYGQLIRKQPDTPKLVAEFWSGWFEHWGAPAATQKTPQLYEKRMLEVVQAGFSGLSHYMFFGGTNFAGYGGRTVGASDIFMVTSYDYDAPLNEYGRTTPKYFAAKRFSYFVRAIEPFLLASEPLDAAEAGVRATAGLKVRGRRLGEQSLWFVESGKDERETFHITLANGRTLPVIVNPGEIVPVLDAIEIGEGVRLTSTTAIGCNEIVNGVRTLIVYAKNGQRSTVELDADAEIRITGDRPLLAAASSDGRTVTFDLYHFREPQRVELEIGGEPLRLIVLNQDEMDRAWRIGDGQWLFGCDDVDLTAGSGGGHRVHVSQTTGSQPQPPALEAWSSAALELGQAQGVSVVQPLDFSSFSQPFGYLLYSCRIEREADGETAFILPKLQDTARVYVNGVEASLIREVGSASVRLPLRKGDNQVQLLVQNMGRLNFSPYLGEPKGLFETGYVDGSVQDLRKSWETSDKEVVHLDQAGQLEENPVLSRSFRIEGQDRAVLVGAVAAPLRINGAEVPMEGYQNWFANQSVDISDFVREGNNVIEMPYVKSPVARLELLAYRSADGVQEWSMAGVEDGGPGAESANYSGLGVPAWHTCEFARPKIPETIHAKLKLRLTGMSKGTIWLNGINLGRYWQIGPQEDYKIPMAWLKESNVLVLFDEEGRSPERVRLLFDEQTSREWVERSEGYDGI